MSINAFLIDSKLSTSEHTSEKHTTLQVKRKLENRKLHISN